MIGESKIDQKLTSKESITELKYCIDVENSQKIGIKSEINYEFHNEHFTKNFDQIQTFSNSNMEQINSHYLYLTTTASSSDQIIDHSNPAFPIKEFEDYRKSRIESNLDLNDIQKSENNKNLIELKVPNFNSIIKEDKEKRKVIVEWLNNNEWSCKQWSCKKFGKEGAAKRAIQFLEKIHGTTIDCLPEGFYSTLLKIGSLEGNKSSYSRRKSANYFEKNANKKKSKAIQDTETQKLDLSLISSFKFDQIQNFHQPQIINLIQKIMLLLSPLESNFFKLKKNPTCNQPKIHENNQLEWELLHYNCRRLLRKLVLENTKNKKFLLNEYDLLLNQANQILGVNQADTDSDTYQLVTKVIFDSIFSVKTVKEVLNKTVKSDLQLYYSIKDIIQIIKMNEEKVINDQNYQVNSNYWDKVIENTSRLNDDLNYLLKGGLPGYSSVTCSNYGNGFFHFNCKNNPNFNSKISSNAVINHKKSCMNSMHESIQENGYRLVYSNYERRIATRLQGKVQNLENCEFTDSSSQKLLDNSSILSDNITINKYNIDNCETDCQSMQMSNGIYTLLDIKYGIKGGQSKMIFSDILKSKKLHYDENINNNNENDNQILEKKIRKRKSTLDLDNNRKIQRLNQEKVKLQKSKIEWWKKPRGWKVTYYKEGKKYSQIFRVSLNSTNIERESQYKFAYNFYLSTCQEKKEEIEINKENDNLINSANGINTILCDNTSNSATEKLVSSNFLYNIPNIINTPNLIQMLSKNINSRNITPNNATSIGNIFPLNYCLPSLFSGYNHPLYGIGINNDSNTQNDQGYTHSNMENRTMTCSSTQIPYQTYTPFIPAINPFIIPVFPSLMQNLSLNQHKNSNNSTNTEWNEFPINTKELTLNSNITNIKNE